MKEEQRKLITEIMNADEKDGLYEQQTAVEWFAEITAQLGYVSADVLKEAKQKENDRIRRIAYNAYCQAQVETPSENNFNRFFIESIKDH